MICFAEHINNNPCNYSSLGMRTTLQSSMILFEAYFRHSAPSELRQRPCLFYYLLYLFVARASLFVYMRGIGGLVI